MPPTRLRTARWIGRLAAGLAMVGGVMAAQAPAPSADKPGATPPPALPGDGPGRWEPLPVPSPDLGGPSDPVQRLKAEREALRAAREARPAAPLADDSSAAERLRLKARLLELIEQLKERSAARLRAPADARPADPAADRSRPVDLVRQVQNFYQAGEFQAALRAASLGSAADLSRLQFAVLRYVEASCHRRLGDYTKARAIYQEIVDAKDEPFVAECAAWQLGALQTRAELLGRIGKAPPAGPKGKD